MVSHVLLDNRFNFAKFGKEGTNRLAIDSKGSVIAPKRNDILPLKKIDFATLTTHFSAFVDTCAQDQKRLTSRQVYNLRYNIDQWNTKIESYNRKLNASSILAVSNSALEFFSCSKMSLKLIPLDTKKIDPRPSWDDNDATPVGKWLNRHANDFIAHAIHPKNVGHVFADGVIRSAGELLKTKGTVFNEQTTFFNEYSQTKAPNCQQIETLIKHQHERLLTIWKRMTDMKMGPDHLPETAFCPKERDEFFTIVSEIAKKNNQNDLKLDSELRFYMGKIDPYWPKISAVYEKFKAHSQTISSTFEQKKYLEKCWEKLSQPIKFIGDQFSDVCHSIRAVQNDIVWTYGEVVVLRGNPKTIIGAQIDSIVKGEVGLLSPHQNKGDYFALDLIHEDTLILGPKSVLEKHKAKFPNIQYLEDLTAEQRVLLKK